MGEVIDFEEDVLNHEETDMGSINHSIAQTKITSLLDSDERFTTMVELSLDISKRDLTPFELKVKEELKPDICLYPNHIWYSKPKDMLKMPEMPLLAIEILSPKQGINDILSKFEAYFSFGVKSCWLVIPANESITVYSKPEVFKLFSTNETELVDKTIDIHLPIQKVFRRPSE